MLARACKVDQDFTCKVQVPTMAACLAGLSYIEPGHLIWLLQDNRANKGGAVFRRIDQGFIEDSFFDHNLAVGPGGIGGALYDLMVSKSPVWSWRAAMACLPPATQLKTIHPNFLAYLLRMNQFSS